MTAIIYLFEQNNRYMIVANQNNKEGGHPGVGLSADGFGNY